MVEEFAHRRLTAIMATDVVGYSRLMALDETATLATLKAHRRELIDSEIARRQGRIVKLTGDGMLVEFTSVVNAVACAAEIQSGMRVRNAHIPEDGAFSCVSASMSATLSWMTTTFLVTA